MDLLQLGSVVDCLVQGQVKWQVFELFSLQQHVRKHSQLAVSPSQPLRDVTLSFSLASLSSDSYAVTQTVKLQQVRQDHADQFSCDQQLSH
jgi:hypothetical protein